jgi:DNA-binding MarR family transcriptional regulator
MAGPVSISSQYYDIAEIDTPSYDRAVTDDEQPPMSVLFDLWLVNHLLSAALDEVLTEASGLNGEEFGFYSLLRRFGPVPASQISRWTAMRPTTLSALVRRLQLRGHVEQRPNPADGRSRLLALTPAGEEAHAVTADAFFTATRPLAAALGADEIGQRASLQRLDAALRQVGGLDPRPYSVAAGNPAAAAPATGEHQLAYAGRPLSPAEEDSVRAYLDFVRDRSDQGAAR